MPALGGSDPPPISVSSAPPRALQAAAPDLTASMEIVPEKPGTKPPLLRRMEDFLAREMLLLEDSPQGAGLEAQLQVSGWHMEGAWRFFR